MFYLTIQMFSDHSEFKEEIIFKTNNVNEKGLIDRRSDQS